MALAGSAAVGVADVGAVAALAEAGSDAVAAGGVAVGAAAVAAVDDAAGDTVCAGDAEVDGDVVSGLVGVVAELICVVAGLGWTAVAEGADAPVSAAVPDDDAVATGAGVAVSGPVGVEVGAEDVAGEDVSDADAGALDAGAVEAVGGVSEDGDDAAVCAGLGVVEAVGAGVAEVVEAPDWEAAALGVVAVEEAFGVDALAVVLDEGAGEDVDVWAGVVAVAGADDVAVGEEPGVVVGVVEVDAAGEVEADGVAAEEVGDVAAAVPVEDAGVVEVAGDVLPEVGVDDWLACTP